MQDVYFLRLLHAGLHFLAFPLIPAATALSQPLAVPCLQRVRVCLHRGCWSPLTPAGAPGGCKAPCKLTAQITPCPGFIGFPASLKPNPTCSVVSEAPAPPPFHPPDLQGTIHVALFCPKQFWAFLIHLVIKSFCLIIGKPLVILQEQFQCPFLSACVTVCESMEPAWVPSMPHAGLFGQLCRRSPPPPAWAAAEAQLCLADPLVASPISDPASDPLQDSRLADF